VVDVEKAPRSGAMPDAANEWRTELAITPNRRARLEIPAASCSTPAGGNPVCAAAAGQLSFPSMVSLRFGATEQKRVLTTPKGDSHYPFCGKSHQSALRCGANCPPSAEQELKITTPKHLCRRRVLNPHLVPVKELARLSLNLHYQWSIWIDP